MATLVQLDPIYVYLQPERDPSSSRSSPIKKKGSLEYSHRAGRQVDLSAHPGKLDFVNNQVDQATGTLRMRAVFPESGTRALLPGQYAEVQRPALTDAARHAGGTGAAAVGENEGGFYVFVVDKDDKVEQRQVKLGAAYKTGRVVTDGLKAGDRVVVKGLQKIHGGETVTLEDDAKSGGQSASQ